MTLFLHAFLLKKMHWNILCRKRSISIVTIHCFRRYLCKIVTFLIPDHFLTTLSSLLCEFPKIMRIVGASWAPLYCIVFLFENRAVLARVYTKTRLGWQLKLWSEVTVWSFARASKRPQKRERLHVGEGRRCASDKTTHAFDLPRVEAHGRRVPAGCSARGFSKLNSNRA